MEISTILVATLLAVVCLFQLALAAGAPFGAAAWGGANPGVLPAGLRISSAIAGLLIYPLIILLVLSAAGMIELAWLPRLGRTGMFVLAGLFTLGGVGNLVSRSRVERLWGPVALAIAAGCGLIAAGL